MVQSLDQQAYKIAQGSITHMCMSKISPVTALSP